jgi:sigma-B regulation protein RsbU (phosphoserine phosphatase)
VRADGSVSDVALTGLPLGVAPESRFETFSAQLMPGDSLLLYSDGLTDCRNESGDMLGQSALRNMVRASGKAGQDAMLGQLESGLDGWRGTEPLADDVSLLLLGLDPEATVTVLKNLPDPSPSGAT